MNSEPLLNLKDCARSYAYTGHIQDLYRDANQTQPKYESPCEDLELNYNYGIFVVFDFESEQSRTNIF